MKSSKLYKILKPTENIFTITPVSHGERKLSDSPALVDKELSSLTITHAIDTPSTCEFTTPARGSISRPGLLIAATYTPPPALKAISYNPNQSRRFTGVIINSEDDISSIIGGREKSTTTTTAAGFSRYLSTQRTISPGTKPSFPQIWINHLSKITNSAHYFYGDASAGSYYPNPENKEITASNLTSAIKEAGHQIIDLRDGAIKAQDYARPVTALAGKTPGIVIEARQVIEKITAQNRGDFQNFTSLPSFYTPENLENPVKLLPLWQKLIIQGHIVTGSQELDWNPIESAVYPSTGSGSYPERLTLTHLLKEYGAYKRLEKITIDLLFLAKQPYADPDENKAGLALINALMAAEAGDMILLADSFGNYTGRYQITELKETITPDTWSMELSINPEALLTGIPDSLRTWDKAPFPWDSPNMTDWTS